MDQQTISSSKQDRWVWASCPSTGEEVVGSSWQEELIVPDAHATWWYCPACHGWHVQHESCQNHTRPN